MNFINNKNYFPMLVSEIASKDDSSEDFLVRWEQYDSISKKLQTLLTSKELSTLISFIIEKHNLSDLEASNISRNIRKLFFREISEEVFSKNISKILGGDDLNGKTIISAIKKIKVSNTPISIKEPEIEKITLRNALVKYPELNNELITSNYLKFPDSDKKVTPTIKNWLDLYDQEVGVKNQTTVQRGKFLYSSKNCSRLSETEREIISKLLQSRDENTELNLNKETHKIFLKHDDVDINNYKFLIAKTKVFAMNPKNNLSTQLSKKITSIADLKGKKSSLNTTSPQYFSKLSNNVNTNNLNIKKEKQDTDLVKKNCAKAPNDNKISFSSGQKLSTELNAAKIETGKLNQKKRSIFNIKPISKSN